MSTTDADVNNLEASSASNTDVNSGSQAPASENAAPAAQTESTPGTQDANTNAAATSSAEKDANTKRASLLDVVKNAAAKPNPDKASSAVGKDGGASKDSDAEKTPKDDVKPADEKAEDKLPFHNHPRWKQLISEREAMKPRAEQYEKIEQFMAVNNLAPNEVAEGFRVMSLIKNNPFEAYKVLQGHLQKLAPIVGESLPEDIEKRIDQGSLDAESARELAKARAQAQLLAQREQAFIAQRQEQEADALRAQSREAVVAWENGMKVRDPDYSVKQKFVRDRVRVMLTEVDPQTPREAVALVEKAYAEVNEQFKGIAPRPQSVRAVTSTASSSTSAQPLPKSLLDVVRMAARS